MSERRKVGGKGEVTKTQAVTEAVSTMDSLASTPGYCGSDSWEEPPFPSATAATTKMRLMCSYGGRILPRPTDKALCYLGGETRIVVAERGGRLGDLLARLARILPLGGIPFTLKYQLPSEDLDSLISVSTDEDLDNLVDEYDRLLLSSNNPSKPARIRLFLFPSNNSDSGSAPSSAIGSFLDDDCKSESWFMDALNSALPHGSGSADSASVNSLLGLNDDDSSANSRVRGRGREELQLHHLNEKITQHGQDVQSTPDSPMLEAASSSFGSSSSAFSLSNLPPIRIRPDNRHPDQIIGALEEHFARMNFPSSVPPAATAAMVAHQRVDEVVDLPKISVSTPVVSTVENSSSNSCGEKPEHGGGVQKAAYAPQQKPNPLHPTVSDPITRPRGEVPISDSVKQMPSVQAPNTGYTLPLVQLDQLQLYQQHQNQQLGHPNQHYFHSQSGGAIPVPAYYHIPYVVPQSQQQSFTFDRQIPMYFLPVQQVPSYNSAAQANQGDPYPISPVGRPSAPLSNPVLQQQHGDGSNTVPSSKAELPANLYRTVMPATHPTMRPVPRTTLIPAAAHEAHTYSSTGFHLMHRHPSQSFAPMANYAYEFAAPTSSQGYYAQMALASQYQTGSAAAPRQQADMK